MGHAAWVSRSGPCAYAHRSGALARDVPEYPTEGTQAGPSGLERNIGDGQIGFTKQGGRSLDPPSKQVPMRRDAERLFERPREVGRGDVTYPREAAHWPGLM